MVGCGALGCEFLKNFALNGICCGVEGSLSVTDPDLIELSNLTRQFLFRENNVGSNKAKAGSDKAREINDTLKIKHFELKASEETENVFDDDFWMSLDGVCMALDNVSARQYIDRQSIKYGKANLESATMGTVGNVSAIVPFQTTTYQPAPEDGDIPACTLKNFPHLTEHCIQWARSQFEDLFLTLSKESKKYLETPKFFEDKLIVETDSIASVRIMTSFLKAINARTLDSCVETAYLVFHVHFRDKIKDLQKLPDKSYDANANGPYWTLTRRYPRASDFDIAIEAHVDFVAYTALLFACNLGVLPIKPPKGTTHEADWLKQYRRVDGANMKWCTDIISKLSPVDYLLAPVHITGDIKAESSPSPSASSSSASSSSSSSSSSSAAASSSSAAAATVTAPESGDILQKLLVELREARDASKSATTTSGDIIVQDFEKDDDLNFHIDFMVACSNLRCLNYRLDLTDFNNCKAIAGRIIPALASTTTSTAGLVMFELFKIKLGYSREAFRSRDLFLCTNGYTNNECTSPDKFQTGHLITNKEEDGSKICAAPDNHSCWDFIEVPGSMTLSQFITFMEETYQVVIDEWRIIYGESKYTSASARGDEKEKKTKPVDLKVHPVAVQLDPSNLPSLNLNEEAAKKSIENNNKILSLHLNSYIEWWKTCKKAGQITQDEEMNYKDTTLKDICFRMQVLALPEKIAIKYFSGMENRKFFVLDNMNSNFSAHDATTFDDITHLVRIKVNFGK